LLMPLALFATALMAASPAALAQTVEVPGGATGSNVACIQAGELNGGTFVGTFLETGPGTWEERLKAGTFKLQEKNRDDLAVNLADDVRSAAIEFDFVNKTIKYKPASSQEKSGRDRYYILNATDKAHDQDCAALAQQSAAAGAGNGQGPGGGGPGGGGGGGARPSGPGNTPIVMMQVPPRMQLDIPPGTQFTAVGGPPCPGSPGFFLCPNRFSCAPIGGVCCPGVGGCAAGTFCDHFIPNNCIGPGNPRFCSPTGTPGIAAHCDVGLTCLGGNNCQ
jgi:hypothetical protein